MGIALALSRSNFPFLSPDYIDVVGGVGVGVAHPLGRSNSDLLRLIYIDVACAVGGALPIPST